MASYEQDPGWQYLKLSHEKMLECMNKPYDSKKNCWVPDEEEGYIAAEIKSTKGDQVTVLKANKSEVTVKKEQVQDMNPPKFECTEDMSNLSILNDACVLHNLRARYFQMLIYTYSGLFCIVINPYKRLPIYTESIVKIFMGKRRNEIPPHLFSVSDEAYRNMLQDRANQSMLITGESGAGKTENTKKVISYFATVGATQQKKVEGQEKASLEDQIVQMNPVLEAFGNAKTVRNNNSSRFGKFIRIHFDGKGKLTGCDIEHYLLEKSRVVRQAPGERCYHIFYQIMSGQIPDLREKLQLDQDLRYYHFVSQAELTIDGVDDKEEMKMADEAFDVLGFSAQEKFDVFRLCAAMMHMGEMKFKQRPREEQADVDGTEEAEKACAMMGVGHDDFLKALTRPRVKVGTEWVNKGQNLEQVNWAIGAMCKGIYSRMFNWLVKKCNKTLDVQGTEKKHFIGVLDIAGFEIFDLNSFEQLWINFVNEKLQQFFNHHMFVLEQEEYQREGIHWEFIDFGLDLAACIELIEKPLGIVSMLDEECIVPKATDMTYVQKLNDNHLGKHANFQKPKPPKGKQADAHFSLVHYAGTVRYNVINWLEKNKDPLNDSCVSVLKKSQNNQLNLEIWSDYTTQEEAAAAQAKDGGGGGKKKGKSSAFLTVSMLYRESLNNLMNMLHTTHPHFIRCIIPNEIKKSGYIEAGLVLNQLTCNGVLEGIRICRKGFPNRLLYPDFKQRYTILAADAAKSTEDNKKSGEGIMAQLVKENLMSEEEFRIGKTKIFFKAGVLAKLEEMRDTKLSAIYQNLQAKVRWHLALKEAKVREEQRAGFVILSRNIKQWVSLRTWPWFKLYGFVKPMLKAGKEAEEMEKLNERLKELEESLEKTEKLRKELEDQNTKLITEKNEMFLKLQSEKDGVADGEVKAQKLASLKESLEKQLGEQMERLADQEERNAELQKAKKKMEQDAEILRKNIQEMEMSLRKAESEKQSKDGQIRSLQDEMHHQDELIAKLNREKKQQEESNRKLGDDLQGEEDRVNHLNKVKAKLEQNLDDLEEALEREKRGRQELDKSKRKLEGDFKVLQENLEEFNKQKHDLQNNLKKKEQEVHTMASRLEDSSSLAVKLQKQIKDMQGKLDELEEELNAERQARAKSEKSRVETQRELEELNERLDEAGGATHAQIEMNKKREADLAKLRRDMDEANVNHETQLSALRKKHNDAVTEMGDQLDQLQKQKAKIEKEKMTIQRELEELHAAVDSESKAKGNFEKTSKMLEMQLAEAQAKCDEQSRQLADFANSKNRLQNENADLTRQLEEAESQLNAMQRVRTQLQGQLEEAKHTADDEARERQNIAAQLRNYQQEVDSLREQLDDEGERKNEAQRLVAKANSEVLQWRARFENEGLSKTEELEDAKRKLAQRLQDMQELLEQTNAKAASLEKTRQRLIGELDDAQVEVDRANTYSSQMEKKQKGFDKIVDDWKRQCDDLHAELDASQREARELGTEVFRIKTQNEEVHEQMESIRRENKSLAQEIKDLSDQLGEGGRSVHEMQKSLRRLELEKEELQQALDEAEAALEAEESKVLRSQVEVSQIRQEIEKRIREKEDDFENTRKNHQRALESMQASLEVESKGRAELMRVKKKLESDINELEIGLDHANKANADAQKNMKKYQEQIRELQQLLDDEQRARDEMREQYDASEKRCELLQSEKSAMMTAMEQIDRARKQAETEMHDIREQLNELSSQNAALTSLKRKIESELQALRAEFDDTMNELKSSEERGKKAMIDAAKLADELRQEQEHSAHVERLRKGLEGQLKEMQARLDEAEGSALKGGKKIIAKLEQRIRDLEIEMDGEQRRYADSQKNFAKQDRRCKELQFQVEEDKKSQERLQDLIENLQEKLKAYKRQAEEAEEVANVNLAKYRQLQQQLGDAEERAELAENSLSKLRAKNRSSTTVGGPATGLSPSPSMVRSFSRNRFSSSALNE